MEVIMVKPTRWNGASLKAGDVVPVDLAVGQRWIRNGIAQQVEEEQAQVISDVGDGNPGSNPYDGLKAKELYELCIGSGIEAEEKQSKAYYIEKLEAASNKE